MKCNHPNEITIILENSVHYGKRVCADCGKWLGWLPNPKTTKLVSKQTQCIQDLLQNNTLPNQHRQFIQSISQSPKRLSPKQQKYLFDLHQQFSF